MASASSPSRPVPPVLEHALRAAELAVQRMSDALLQGDADTTQVAAAALQQSTAELGQAWASVHRNQPAWRPGHDLVHRLQAVQQALGLQREACLRRGGHAARALQVLVPAAQDPTYRRRPAAATAYGPARQTGAFRLLSA